MYTFSFICMPFRSIGIGNITSVVTVKTYVYTLQYVTHGLPSDKPVNFKCI